MEKKIVKDTTKEEHYIEVVAGLKIIYNQNQYLAFIEKPKKKRDVRLEIYIGKLSHVRDQYLIFKCETDSEKQQVFSLFKGIFLGEENSEIEFIDYSEIERISIVSFNEFENKMDAYPNFFTLPETEEIDANINLPGFFMKKKPTEIEILEPNIPVTQNIETNSVVPQNETTQPNIVEMPTENQAGLDSEIEIPIISLDENNEETKLQEPEGMKLEVLDDIEIPIISIEEPNETQETKLESIEIPMVPIEETKEVVEPSETQETKLESIEIPMVPMEETKEVVEPSETLETKLESVEIPMVPIEETKEMVEPGETQETKLESIEIPMVPIEETKEVIEPSETQETKSESIEIPMVPIEETKEVVEPSETQETKLESIEIPMVPIEETKEEIGPNETQETKPLETSIEKIKEDTQLNEVTQQGTTSSFENVIKPTTENLTINEGVSIPLQKRKKSRLPIIIMILIIALLIGTLLYIFVLEPKWKATDKKNTDKTNIQTNKKMVCTLSNVNEESRTLEEGTVTITYNEKTHTILTELLEGSIKFENETDYNNTKSLLQSLTQENKNTKGKSQTYKFDDKMFSYTVVEDRDHRKATENEKDDTWHASVDEAKGYYLDLGYTCDGMKKEETTTDEKDISLQSTTGSTEVNYDRWNVKFINATMYKDQQTMMITLEITNNGTDTRIMKGNFKLFDKSGKNIGNAVLNNEVETDAPLTYMFSISNQNATDFSNAASYTIEIYR